jgi:1,4-alpha-glucan branching enzyme
MSSSVPVHARPYLEAIAGGYHRDPFSVLGLHEVEAGWEVRAFLPQAETVELLADGLAPVLMERIHPTGIWLAAFEARPALYRFRLHVAGSEYVEYDPFSFPPVLTPFQLHLHGEGTNYEGYNMLGAHLTECEGVAGVRFAVWAPNALVVSVAGDFNGWDTRRHPMRMRDGGIWELFLPELGEGTIYKYFVKSQFLGYAEMKADPYAFRSENPPLTGSIVKRLSTYEWRDSQWIARRGSTDWLHQPISVYEVHLGSWLRAEGNRQLSYRELADKLVTYVKQMGFTHIELLPILEHPYTPSWGYQVTGYFAPTSRFGTPDDFKFFIDACHQAGIGVLLDWVPAHFPRDAHGLAHFDGTALYEHEDPRQGEHRDWGTKIFNFGRNEVRTFLISSALFWLKEYHIDGLRVDAVASMLYLDYSRQEGEWIPNQYGGRENLEAIGFLKRFNEQVHLVPGAVSIAEESTSFPAVSRPVYAGGLGFTFKWNMGWMHDMLAYFQQDAIFRKYHQNSLTFSLLYAFSENFMLPISHDEVVHGKGSLLNKMTGDEWQRFANARAFLAYMWTHPGKKLLFMGCEIGMWQEWNHDASLPWEALEYPAHAKLQRLVKELNRIYQEQPALWEVDDRYEGFDWIDFHDVENSTIAFLRWSKHRRDFIVVVCNFTPVPRTKYKLGVPSAGVYDEILNTDSEMFGGSNMGNAGGACAEAVPSHGHPASLSITLPPLSVVAFRLKREGDR